MRQLGGPCYIKVIFSWVFIELVFLTLNKCSRLNEDYQCSLIKSVQYKPHQKVNKVSKVKRQQLGLKE